MGHRSKALLISAGLLALLFISMFILLPMLIPLVLIAVTRFTTDTSVWPWMILAILVGVVLLARAAYSLVQRAALRALTGPQGADTGSAPPARNTETSSRQDRATALGIFVVKRGPMLVWVLVIGGILGGTLLWNSLPPAREHQAQVYQQLQAELSLVASYPGAAQHARTDHPDVWSHGPTIELQYSFPTGACSDVHVHYTQAASRAGWTLTKRQDYGDETITNYGKTVGGNALTLSVDCRDSDSTFEVWFAERGIVD